MTTAIKHSIEISPKVYLAGDPAGAIDAINALNEKRDEIFSGLIKCHFPTFGSGELMDRAGKFINVLARGNVKEVEITVTLDERSYYVTWLKITFLNGETVNFQNTGWSMPWISRDAAFRFQAFANLLGVEAVLKDETLKV